MECLRCDVPVQCSSEWSRHPWICDTSSPLNSPGSLRAHVRFVGEVCERFLMSSDVPSLAFSPSSSFVAVIFRSQLLEPF